MNNIITIRQFVSILQQKGFMAEQPDSCESIVLSFFHTIAEALKTEDIVSIDGLGDFTIVNRESGLIIFMPDQALADIVNEPFAFFEPTEISDVVTNEMLEVPTTEMPKDAFNEEVKEITEVKDTPEPEEPKKPAAPVKADPQDRNAYVISVPKTENTYHEQTSVSQPGSFEETPDPKTIEREQELKREQELRRELERELEIRRELEMRREQELRKEQEEAQKAEEKLEEEVEESENSGPEFIPEQSSDDEAEDVVVDETDEVAEEDETEEQEETETNEPKENNGHSTITLVAIAILALAIGFVAGLFSAEHLFAEDDEDIGYQSNVAEQIELLRNELFSPEETQKLEAAINKSIQETATDSTAVQTKEIAETNNDVAFDDEPVVITDTVKENHFLTHMSRQYYGGVMEFWVYIYLENQDHLGHPAKIKPNTVVVIPPAEKYGIDPNSKKSIDLAKQIASEIDSKYK